MFLGLFTSLIVFFEAQLNLNPQMTIAFAHGSYNLLNTAIQFPFIGALAWLVTKLIPGEDSVIEYRPKHLDPLVIKKSSSLALEQAKAEIVHMGEFAYRGLEETSKFISSSNPKHSETALQIEGALNNLDHKVTEYLVDISADSMTKLERAKHSFLLDSVRDIERIGDHFENIIELGEYKISNKVNLTEQAMEDLNNMIDLTLLAVKQAVESLNDRDKEAALEVTKKKSKLTKWKEITARNILYVLTKVSALQQQALYSLIF